jgi:mRNA interferase HicA
MKTGDLKRQLRALGARFEEGTKHTKVYLGTRRTIMPRHSEIPDNLAKAILKQLGVK